MGFLHNHKSVIVFSLDINTNEILETYITQTLYSVFTKGLYLSMKHIYIIHTSVSSGPKQYNIKSFPY